MDNTEAAWLACAIDGEGTLSILDDRGVVSVRLSVYNTSEEFIRRAEKLMEAHVYRTEPGTASPLSRRPIFSAQIGAHEKVLTILHQILPFLIIKRKKALEAIRRIETHDWAEAKAKAAAKRWADPEQHVRAANYLRRRWKDPSQRANFIEAIKKNWRTPEVRSRMIGNRHRRTQNAR